MKQPKLENLKVDLEGTKKIRSTMAKVKKAKNTAKRQSPSKKKVS